MLAAAGRPEQARALYEGLRLTLADRCRLAEIDAGDPPAAAFLESSNPANLRRYERLGFRPTREVELIGGLSGTQMWRGPGGGVPPGEHARFDP